MKGSRWRPTAIQPRSIAFRLIAAVLAVEFAAWLMAVALSFGYERHMHFRALGAVIHGHAEAIFGAVQEDANDNLQLMWADVHTPPDHYYEVFDEHGRLLGQSPNWEGIPLTEAPLEEDHHRPPFFFRTIHGHETMLLRWQGMRSIDADEPGRTRQASATVVYGIPTRKIWESIQETVEFYALCGVGLMLVTGPLIAWLLHHGLRPLRQLATLASGVSVNSWSFEPPPSAYKTPELAPLTHALQNVLQRLEKSFEQQRVFVSDAAHELKTAVAVVKSSLQLLGLKPRTVEEYKVGLERCLADCARLEEIVGKMLTLAREESTAPAQTIEARSDLAYNLGQTLEQLKTAAELRKVSMSLTVPMEGNNEAEIPVGISLEDSSLLFLNLLLNALQHSPAESSVETRLAVEEANHAQYAVVEIADHGDGIAAEALPHVFDRFYRGDPSRNRNTGGTGLGLAIAKAVAERARGSIAIASTPGQGTTVTVRLPMASKTPSV